jgi:hypothetical protein
MIRSPTTMASALDSIMAGATLLDAAHSVGARSVGVIDTWRASGIEAEQRGDTSSAFYLTWADRTDYFHNLIDYARARRAAILGSPFIRGEFAVRDGRVEFVRDDFGAVVFEGDVPQVMQRVVVAEAPLTGKHRPDPAAVFEAMHPRRELAPASYSGNKPKAVPAFVGSALGDYLKGSKMTVDKQPTPLRKELETLLAEARANPNRASARPRPIAVLGRREEGPQERVSNQSDQRGLPTQMADAPRREAPQPKPLPVDYSRRGPPVRLDAPGRG